MQQPVQWVIGQTSPAWLLSLLRDNETAVDLTGVTGNQLSFLVYSEKKVLLLTGAGTFTFLSADRGLLRYALATSDVPTTPGTYFVRIKINFNSANPYFTDFIEWEVRP